MFMMSRYFDLKQKGLNNILTKKVKFKVTKVQQWNPKPWYEI